MSESVILSKVANCFVEDAAPSEEFLQGYAAAGMPAKSVERALPRFKDRHGGFWVGGRLFLTRTHLRFEPNAANRAVHGADGSVELRLADIRSLEVLPGLVTKIISIRTDARLVSLRCFGARSVAQRIQDEVARGHGPQKHA